MRPQQFRTKDIDLITCLRFKKFTPISNPIQDISGTRWVIFNKTTLLEKAVLDFYKGNTVSAVLDELRKTRSFLLDSPVLTENEIERKNGFKSGKIS
jgi:hypothetical protein